MQENIVVRAAIYGVVDIGQITPQQRKELDKAVRVGLLSRGKGGPYANLKTVWNHRGFDFAYDRQLHIDHAMKLAELDRVNREARR